MKKQNTIKYIDLFAGIGGIRRGFDKNGFECVWTCEINKFAQQTYMANYPGSIIHDDIRTVDIGKLPQFDFIVGGFPCQPFSLAGVSSKNFFGQKHGFECQKQGNLFFEIAKIIKERQPVGFLLENVKNLKNHQKGETFKVIMDVLDSLNYHVDYKVISGDSWVPQKRERVFIVGFKKKTNFTFDNVISGLKHKPVLKDILHDFEPGFKPSQIEPYFLSDKLWKYLQYHAKKHQDKGNGFGFGLHDETMVARTLSARYYKDGSEILIRLNNKNYAHKNPRRLTPRECARLMGFEDDFIIPVSNTQAYRQFGNSVVYPLIADIAKEIKRNI